MSRGFKLLICSVMLLMQIVVTADEVSAEACAFASSMSKAMLFTRNLQRVRLRRWKSTATTPDLLLEVPSLQQYH